MSTPKVDGTELVRQLHHMGERLAEILDEGLADPNLTPAQAHLLLQEMATGIEELRVAEEELTIQAEQLNESNAELDAQRRRYARLFEFAPDAYVETDGLGRIVEANGAAERLFKAKVRFLTGKVLDSFLDPEDARTLRQRLSLLGDNQEPGLFEVDVVDRDGHKVPVEIVCAAHPEPESQEVGAMRARWMLRDITERRLMERQMRQLHADVELLASLMEVNRLVEDAPRPVAELLAAAAEVSLEATGAVGASARLIDEQGRSTARAATNPRAERLDEVDNECAGPARHAALTGHPVVCRTGDGSSRWPAMDAELRREGLGWAAAQPAPVAGGGSVVVVAYGKGPDDDAVRVLPLLATHAAAVVGNTRLYTSATQLARNLEVALESRGVIEQAKGILMAWQGCGPDDAFDILRRASQRENRKLRVIAEEIVAKAAAHRPQS